VCGWSRRHDRERRGSFKLVHVAWPELSAPRAGTAVTVTVAGDAWDVGGNGRGNISASIAADFTRDAPGRLARAVARTVARQAMMSAGDAAMDRAKKEKKRDDEDDDKDDDNDRKWIVAGVAAYLFAGASTLAERADTRSWRTLPNELVVTRIPLAPGEHVVRQNGDVVAEVRMVPRGVAIVHVHD
jgi:hypothetical protein